MTTIRDGIEAGVDAVIADNTLDRGGFADAIRTVITDGLSGPETNTWIDAIATFFNSLGIINNPSYANLRGEIINSGKDTFLALWDVLEPSITGLTETAEPQARALLQSLREDRDNADAAQARFDTLLAAEVGGGAVGRLVRTEMREAKQRLASIKAMARLQIRDLTGDPDST